MQLWLEQTSGLWAAPVFFSSEESASLEVLSELCPCPSSPPLSARDSKLTATHNCVMDRLVESRKAEACSAQSGGWQVTRGRSNADSGTVMTSWRGPEQNGLPCHRSPLLESQDAYVTLSSSTNQREEQPFNGIFEETLPLEMLFTSRKQICESHSDFGSMQQSSASSPLSSPSSFECPPYTWMSKGYTYMAAVDSGLSMDYSPMRRVDDIHSNEYKNGLEAHRRAFLVKTQGDDGWGRNKRVMDDTSTEPWGGSRATLDLKKPESKE